MHGADLAEALVAAGTSDATAGRTYYACHPEVFTGADMARAVGRAMGKSPAVIRVPATIGRGVLMITEAAARLTGHTTILTADKANEFFQPAWTGDPSPLTRDTGWQAAHDLRSRPGGDLPAGIGRRDGCSGPAAAPQCARSPSRPALRPVDLVLLATSASSPSSRSSGRRPARVLVAGGGARPRRAVLVLLTRPGLGRVGQAHPRDLSAVSAPRRLYGELDVLNRAGRCGCTIGWCSAGS